MRYMLDTNICIYAIKHKPEKAFQKLQTIHQGKIRAGLEKERYADRPSRYDDCRSCVVSRVYCCNE